MRYSYILKDTLKVCVLFMELHSSNETGTKWNSNLHVSMIWIISIPQMLELGWLERNIQMSRELTRKTRRQTDHPPTHPPTA